MIDSLTCVLKYLNENIRGAANVPLIHLVENHVHTMILDLIGVERGKIHIQVIPRGFGFKTIEEKNTYILNGSKNSAVFQLTNSDVMKIREAGGNSADVSVDTKKRLKKMQQYKIVEKLQKGGFGTVFKSMYLRLYRY